jgi:hypothetical protein
MPETQRVKVNSYQSIAPPKIRTLRQTKKLPVLKRRLFGDLLPTKPVQAAKKGSD